MPPVPVHPGGLLERFHAGWHARGWDPAGLVRFRMGPDDDALDDLSDDEVEALESLTDDDVKALRALAADDLAKLTTGGEDPRLKQAREESISRRKELKPFKELLRKHGVKTAEELEAKLAAKPSKKKDDKDEPDDDEPDADEIRRAADREATAKANRRIVRAEVKVLARDIFADPDDAPLYVDLDDYEVDDDGDLVDSDEITAALKAVVKGKPHLAKRPAGPQKDKSQGRRDPDAKPSVAAGKEMFEARRPSKAS